MVEKLKIGDKVWYNPTYDGLYDEFRKIYIPIGGYNHSKSFKCNEVYSIRNIDIYEKFDIIFVENTKGHHFNGLYNNDFIQGFIKIITIHEVW